MTLSRRDMLKAQAAAIAAATAGISLPAAAQPVPGAADRTLNLVNDSAAPGSNKVYGTDGSGVRGWKNDPAGGAGGADDMLATVAELLASTEPERGEGEIWQAGGFLYQEASAAAEDAQLETAGGVKLYVLPGTAGHYNFVAMGPAADGETDDWPKLQKMLAIRPPGSAGTYVKGPTIFIPSGAYYMGVDEHGIQLKAVTRLFGEASGQGGSTVGTRLLIPADCMGITVNRRNTINGGEEDPSTGRADLSVIDGLALVSAGGTDTSKHAIWLRARGIVSNCQISGFPGNGIHIHASASGSPDMIGNANNWLIHTLRVSGCEHGVSVQGADANAGYGVFIDATTNRRWGIRDASFLGNTWSACHTDRNGRDVAGGKSAFAEFEGQIYQANPFATEEQYVETQPGTDADVWRLTSGVSETVPWTGGQAVGTYRSGGGYHSSNLNSRCTFDGCYAEGNQGYTWLSQHSIALGGFLKEAPVVTGAAIEGRFGANWSRGPFTSAGTRESDGRTITGTAGGQSQTLTAFEFSDSEHSGTYRWQAQEEGGWILTRNNSGVGVRLRGNSEAYLPNTMQYPRIALGQGATLRSFGRVTYSTSAGVIFPDSGEFTRGDVGLAPNPNAGDFIGWICTTTGTAGSTAVFKKFGAIAGDVEPGSSGKRDVHDRGTLSTGTHTPHPSNGEFQVASNNGAHTIAASTTEHGGYRLVYANAGAAGTITLSGFDAVFDPDDTLGHTVEGSAIEILVALDSIAKVAQVTLLVDAT